MANMCYLDIRVLFGEPDKLASKMEKELPGLIERAPNGSSYMKLDQLFLSHVYVRRDGHEIKIEGLVRWGTNDEEVISLLNWFQKKGTVAYLEVTYEETAGHLLGTYVYEDMEPDILWHHFLPEDEWPEDEDSDDYFDQLYHLLDTVSTDIDIKLTKGNSDEQSS